MPTAPPILPAEVAWSRLLPAEPAAGGAMDRDRIYLSMRGPGSIALDRETGATVWTTDVESAWPPLISGDMVILAAADSLRAFDGASGELRWRADLPAPLNAAMASAGEWLIASAGERDVLAFRVADGTSAWRQSLDAAPRGRPVADVDGQVYFSLVDGRVIALDASDGRTVWTQTLPGTLSEPAVAPDRVFVGSTDNNLYALDSERGTLKWKWTTGGDVVGAASDGQLVYLASLDNIVRALNRGNGNQRWRQIITARPAVPPRTGANVVWLTGLTTLTALSTFTGASLGVFEAPVELQGPPLVDPAIKPFRVAAVVITRDGKVTAVRPTAMMFREAVPAPFTQMPGKILQRERTPLAPASTSN